MEYYIQKRKWKQIFAFLKSVKGVHKKDKDQLPFIECFFGKIKNFRRIFCRFDKTLDVYMGFLNFVGTLYGCFKILFTEPRYILII